MAAATDFIAAILETRTNNLASTVEWSALGSVRITVKIEQAGRTFEAEHHWLVPAKSAADAQRALKAVRDQRGDGASVIVLQSVKQSKANWVEQDARQALRQISHLRYAEALTAYRGGSELLAEGNQQGAIVAFQTGISALGDLYQSPDLIDDTGMKLAIANTALSEDKLDEAAAGLDRVLESRLAVYHEHYKPHTAGTR